MKSIVAIIASGRAPDFEEGFYTLPVLGLVVIAAAFGFIRFFEDGSGKTKNRISTIIWFLSLSGIGIGVVNIAGSFILSCIVALTSLFFAIEAGGVEG